MEGPGRVQAARKREACPRRVQATRRGLCHTVIDIQYLICPILYYYDLYSFPTLVNSLIVHKLGKLPDPECTMQVKHLHRDIDNSQMEGNCVSVFLN